MTITHFDSIGGWVEAPPETYNVKRDFELLYALSGGGMIIEESEFNRQLCIYGPPIEDWFFNGAEAKMIIKILLHGPQFHYYIHKTYRDDLTFELFKKKVLE